MTIKCSVIAIEISNDTPPCLIAKKAQCHTYSRSRGSMNPTQLRRVCSRWSCVRSLSCYHPDAHFYTRAGLGSALCRCRGTFIWTDRFPNILNCYEVKGMIRSLTSRTLSDEKTQDVSHTRHFFTQTRNSNHSALLVAARAAAKQSKVCCAFCTYELLYQPPRKTSPLDRRLVCGLYVLAARVSAIIGLKPVSCPCLFLLS